MRWFHDRRNTFGRSGVGAPTVVMDVLTPLMQILAPSKSTSVVLSAERLVTLPVPLFLPTLWSDWLGGAHADLRAINFQLMTLREKTEVANLIDTMVSLKMTFKQSAAKGFYDPRYATQPTTLSVHCANL